VRSFAGETSGQPETPVLRWWQTSDNFARAKFGKYGTCHTWDILRLPNPI
jgi:hypothetical protein